MNYGYNFRVSLSRSATGVAALTRGFESIGDSHAGGSGGVASEIPKINASSSFEGLPGERKKVGKSSG